MPSSVAAEATSHLATTAATAAMASVSISERDTKETGVQLVDCEKDSSSAATSDGTAADGAQADSAKPVDRRRIDPFMFGQRYLTEEDNVFDYNAWDHVETDDAFKEYAEQQYALQRQSPVSDFDKTRFSGNPTRWWNLFYKNHATNFFKDRKWLQQEFPVLAQACEPDAGPVTILEVGAGAGNTAFPILARNRNPHLRIHACDFSKTAVKVMREHDAYDPRFLQADIWDLASPDELPPGLGLASVDVAVLIFVFSALSPAQWTQAVANIARLVKPGGTVCFRDYGRGDLAQVRFRKGRYLDENFYVRGDGTQVYFFEPDELAHIWTGGGAGAGAGASGSGNTNEDMDDGAQNNNLKQTESSPEQLESGNHGSDTATGSAKSDANDTDATSTSDATKPLFVVEQMGVDRRLIVNRALKLKMYRCWLQGRFRRTMG